ELLSAAEAEHVGRDPADLRLLDRAVPGDRRKLVFFGGFHAMDPRPGRSTAARPAAVLAAVREPDRVLLLLLFVAGVQQQGADGEPEVVRRLRAGHRVGRPDSRSDPQAPARANADR